MDRQDWYLKQCDITQYILRKPMLLKGEIATHISDDIRLLVVSEQKPTQKIYFDILNAIHLSNDQVLYLTPSQLIMPASDLKTVIWFIDIEQNKTWQYPLTIQSTNLETLAHSPQQKRQLWQQLCQYENHFNTNRE